MRRRPRGRATSPGSEPSRRRSLRPAAPFVRPAASDGREASGRLSPTPPDAGRRQPRPPRATARPSSPPRRGTSGSSPRQGRGGALSGAGRDDWARRRGLLCLHRQDDAAGCQGPARPTESRDPAGVAHTHMLAIIRVRFATYNTHACPGPKATGACRPRRGRGKVRGTPSTFPVLSTDYCRTRLRLQSD